jgi:hypothetical protein
MKELKDFGRQGGLSISTDPGVSDGRKGVQHSRTSTQNIVVNGYEAQDKLLPILHITLVFECCKRRLECMVKV